MNNKKIIIAIRILLVLLILLWLISVYILSNQDAKESQSLSGKFIENILKIKDEIANSKKEKLNNNIENKAVVTTKNEIAENNQNVKNENSSKNQTNEITNQNNKTTSQSNNVAISKSRIDRWQKITRKMAHFTLYTIGGFMLYCTVVAFSSNEKLTLRKFLCALALGVAYAITDEIHQLFTSGRAGRIFDVMIDSSGVLTGIIVAIIIISIISKTINSIYERGKNHDRL